MITVKQHGISTYRDVSVQVRVPLTRDGANFFPDANWDLVFTAKLALEDDDVDAVVQKSTVAGITVDGRYAVLDIVPMDTTTLESNTILYCDIKGTNDVLVEQCVAATFLWRVGVSATLDDVTSIPVFTTNPPAGRQLSGINTAGYTALNMLRIASAGGIEERTPAEVGADIQVAFEYDYADPNLFALSVSGTLGDGTDPVTFPLLTFVSSGGVFGEVGFERTWADGDIVNGPYYQVVETVGEAATEAILSYFPDGITGTEYVWGSSAGVAGAYFAVAPATGTPTVVFVVGSILPAGYLGQWCKTTTAWWQWDGTVWIPIRLLTGEPITWSVAQSAYFSIGVDVDTALELTPFS